MNKQIKLAPSILAADFARLGEQVKLVEKAAADLIHFDVMDGHFVPNISFGVPVLASLRKVTDLPLDVHLMIENPADYIDAFVKAGADYLTVHYEACDDVNAVVQSIKRKNIKAGIAIKPATPLSVLDQAYLDELDLVLIMAVDPGFGGQKFIPETLNRLTETQSLLKRRQLEHIEVETDGGVGLENIKEISEAGAEILVCGSSVFNTDNPAQTLKKMKKLLNA